jgi:hypothetical protein
MPSFTIPSHSNLCMLIFRIINTATSSQLDSFPNVAYLTSSDYPILLDYDRNADNNTLLRMQLIK